MPRMTIDLFLERLEDQLKKLEHYIKWAMVGNQLAHGECIRCKKSVLVQASLSSYATVTELFKTPCQDSSASGLSQ